ncbi:MAG: hypothetical protein AAGA48_24800 [Myxococcota bacterium]
MAAPLSERQHQLLLDLRQTERDGTPIDVPALAASTGYSESSIRTYISKRLLGALVHRDEDGAFVVRGALRCTEEAFAHRMSQKAQTAAEALQSEDAWRELVRKLLREGSRRGYSLSDDERVLLDELFDDDELGPTQPSLF